MAAIRFPFHFVAPCISIALAACGGGSSDDEPSESNQSSESAFVHGLPRAVSNPGGNAIATPAPNVLPISVRATNVMLIAVTVCQPGTAACRTIDNVMLDTGSVGLRLSASVLEGLLDRSTGSAPILECSNFGNFYTWGPLRTADIHLGDVQATGIAVQVYGAPNIATASSVKCGTVAGVTLSDAASARSTFGGILGIRGQASDNQKYFSCTATSCQAVIVPPGERLPNPIAKLASDANGFSIQMPAIPDIGAAAAAGVLVLGIGTRDNNGLPVSVNRLDLDARNLSVQILIGGQAVEAQIDSGTGVNAIPSLGMPSITLCKNGQFQLLCPSSGTTVPILIKAFPDARVVISTNLAVWNGSDALAGGNVAFNDIVATVPTVIQSYGVGALLGVPFFYGRNVYFSIAGQPVAVGSTTSIDAFVAF